MARMIEISARDFPSFVNLEPGTPIDVIGTGEVVDVRKENGEEIVVISLGEFGGKQGIIGRCERMSRAVEKAMDKNGRIKVTTQVSPMGNT